MNKKELIQDLIEKVNQLPPEIQTAFWWIVENLDFVNELCKGEKMQENIIDDLAQKALEKEDYLLFLLIQYKKIKDQYIQETEEKLIRITNQ